MKPVADFACLSLKCQTEEGEAMVYELPVDATHCPQGHKRLRRLFNKIGVIGLRPLQPDLDSRLTSSSALARSAARLQPGFDHADAHKLQDRSMRSYELHNAPPQVRQAIASQFPGGEARPMSPTEIQQTLRKDPYATSSLLARQWGQGIPSRVKEQ